MSAIDPGRRYVSATPDAIELARIAARAAAERKAEQIIAIDVSERLALTDVFLIVSGANDRQVRSIVDAVDEAMFKAGAKLSGGIVVADDEPEIVVDRERGRRALGPAVIEIGRASCRERV